MNQESLRVIDKSNYYDVLCHFDQHITDALDRFDGQKSNLSGLSKSRAGFRNILICGMGGSAIAGDFIKNVWTEVLGLPIQVCRDYHIPRWVNKESLVIACSYSGNTEETIAALHESMEAQAQILTIATGGTVQSIATQHGLSHITIPGGLQPRQAIGYALTTLHAVFSEIFKSTSVREEMSHIVFQMKHLATILKTIHDNNPYIHDSKILHDKPVIIYASERMFPAALRLKGQITENAKLLAFAYAVPEMNHNEIVGWESVHEAHHAPCHVILLRDREDHPQVQKRFEILMRLLKGKAHWTEYTSDGGTLMERYYNLIYRGDWLSYYMAIARNTDPTPVDIITRLKNKLAS